MYQNGYLCASTFYLLRLIKTRNMGRKATTINEQISLLRTRGMEVDDPDKAKEVLLDIGYYRLGFYWFYFEVDNIKKRRRHAFKPGTSLKDAVDLYYFDYELRNTLLKYLTRIEVNFRTKLIYIASNAFPESPAWFADPNVVVGKYTKTFKSTMYNELVRHNPILKEHHVKHRNDLYAPAWKTIEFMPMGAVQVLYGKLRDVNLKRKISMSYGVNSIEVLENYLSAIRDVRNTCAHGKVLYDIHLIKGLRNGPAGKMDAANKNKLSGALLVICFMLGSISQHRQSDFVDELRNLEQKYGDILKKINFSCFSQK